MLSRNRAKQSVIQQKSWRAVRIGAVRIGATASALAVVLTGAMAGPAWAVPGEARKVHVEGQLIPVEQSHDVYRVTGGLVGTYNLRSERIGYAWTYWDTQIRNIDGTASIRGCVDQNQNQSCDPAEPSGDLKFAYNRVASFDTGTGGCSKASSPISSAAVGDSALAS